MDEKNHPNLDENLDEKSFIQNMDENLPFK
jgi:hypothetical protein